MQSDMQRTGTLFMQPLIPGFLNDFSIPEEYVQHLKQELGGNVPKTVVLMTEDQPHRHWGVSVHGGRHFNKGWKEFCVHHHLKVGEFLVFKHQSYLLFHVSIYDPVSACERQSVFTSNHLKGSKNSMRLNIRTICKRKPKPIQVKAQDATKGVPSTEYQNSRYFVTLSATHIHVGIVYLPMAFVKSSGMYKTCCNMIVIDDEERPWDVKLNHKKNKCQPYIYHGWKDLQVANKFKLGDVISFELLKGGRMPIIKCSRSSKEMLNLQQKLNKRTPIVDPKVLEIVAEALSAPCHSRSYPVNLSNRKSLSTLFLPAEFMKSCGLYKRICDMIVVDVKGRPWNVKLRYNKGSYQAYLSYGWKGLKDANNFKLGDVLRFQLLRDGKTPILKCIA